MISDKALQEFKKIWYEEFNEEISDKEALSFGASLLTIFNHIYRPIKKEWVKTLSDKKVNINENEHNSIPNQK